ncbi:MAG: 5'/3'-nucleotidase SurE [Vicinamibacteria bacterium]|nr:5'/3'-nucleotidase SurE [Vicinamibacteria bacterium]
MARPLILVTNDDGVHAPGIRALAGSLEGLGQIEVVAPDREVSACAQSLTLSRPLRTERLATGIHAVDGTPADCVNLAICKLLGQRPALVVSGINRGPNLGEDVFYSGTVGGAREGTFFGIPSIAMSLASRAEADFLPAATIAARLAALVLERGLPERTLLNVNVPPGPVKQVMLTIQGRREHESWVLEGRDGHERPYYWIKEGHEHWRTDAVSDIHAIHQGIVSITPLQTDTTYHAVINAFRPWLDVLGDGSGLKHG